MVTEFRKPFRSFLSFSPTTGIFLILLFSSIRMFIVFTAARTGDYSLAGLIFMLMIVFTLLTLNRNGYKRIGLRRISILHLGASMVAGIICCSLMAWIAWYSGNSIRENWFVYISTSYTNIPDLAEPGNRLIYFLIFAIIGMSFSPFGEEFLYRGVLHECFSKYGNLRASIIDAAAFSLVHLAHFGIIWNGSAWEIVWIPALLWMTMLFFTCLVFSLCRHRFHSLYAAVAAHAGYNLMMNYVIFYYIL